MLGYISIKVFCFIDIGMLVLSTSHLIRWTDTVVVSPLTTSVPRHIETSQLICRTNQLTCFYMMGNTGRQWVNLIYSLHRKVSITNLVTKKIRQIHRQKESFIDVLKKRCPKNMQQIYRKTPISKCNFKEVAKQLYWNHT